MNPIRLHFLGTLALSLLAGALVWGGWCPSSVQVDQAPVTVRDNPASYRPSYASYTGYRAPVSSSGGGWSSGK